MRSFLKSVKPVLALSSWAIAIALAILKYYIALGDEKHMANLFFNEFARTASITVQKEYNNSLTYLQLLGGHAVAEQGNMTWENFAAFTNT